MDLADLPAYLEDIEARATAAAEPCVLAISRRYRDYVKSRLGQLSHPAQTRTPSPEGGVPAMIAGQQPGDHLPGGSLRRSVSVTPAGASGALAWASVAPHVFYAGIQEEGGDMNARPGRYMRFVTDGTQWNLKHVHVGGRPYMYSSTLLAVANGILSRAAVKAFTIAVWGGQTA